MHPFVAVAVLGIVVAQLGRSLGQLAIALLLLVPAVLLLRGTWRTAGDLRRMGRRWRR